MNYKKLIGEIDLREYSEVRMRFEETENAINIFVNKKKNTSNLPDRSRDRELIG